MSKKRLFLDKRNIEELLNYILESIAIIKRRFESIHESHDFLKDDEGIDRLDAISMRLQSIGEALKNIAKNNPNLLNQVESEEYWSKIIKTREIISHHYIDIDSEIIYEICSEKLGELKSNIQNLQKLL